MSKLQVLDEYSSRSFRVLALAKGVLNGLDRNTLMLMSQEQLEAQVKSLELLGLMVLTNHVRKDSVETIATLQQQ